MQAKAGDEDEDQDGVSNHPCLDCGAPTTGPRCPACVKAGGRPSHNFRTRNPAYDSRAYRRLRASVIAAHVRRHGWTCPGLEPDHAPHPATDLELDHVVPLAYGGQLLDRANCRVLCSSVNRARTGRERAMRRSA